jgi:hypothetical protein
MGYWWLGALAADNGRCAEQETERDKLPEAKQRCGNEHKN